jgi:hypothetical protein
LRHFAGQNLQPEASAEAAPRSEQWRVIWSIQPEVVSTGKLQFAVPRSDGLTLRAGRQAIRKQFFFEKKTKKLLSIAGRPNLAPFEQAAEGN